MIWQSSLSIQIVLSNDAYLLSCYEDVITCIVLIQFEAIYLLIHAIDEHEHMQKGNSFASSKMFRVTNIPEQQC